MLSNPIELFRKLYMWYIRIPIAYRFTKKYNILNSFDSIKYIIDNRCSVSRYGDGEFKIMMGDSNEFQQPNERLAKLLAEVMLSNVPNHVIGIPLPIKSLEGYIKKSQFFWGPFVAQNIKFFKKHVPIEKRFYLDTQLSRFYYMYEDKSHCKEQIELLKKIWDNKDVVIIEGVETRSGVGNDLYCNAKSIQRILGPATNAIEKYDEMLATITTLVSRDKLILLSYGMVATVLAHDLAKDGYWAIDIGHLDIEYEWFKRGVKERIAIEGKFTNEAEGGNQPLECNDLTYKQQIICNITV